MSFPCIESLTCAVVAGHAALSPVGPANKKHPTGYHRQLPPAISWRSHESCGSPPIDRLPSCRATLLVQCEEGGYTANVLHKCTASQLLQLCQNL